MTTPTSAASKSVLITLCLGISLFIMSASEDAHAQYRARGHSNVSVVMAPPGIYAGAGMVAMKIASQDGGDELLEDGAGISLFMGIKLNNRIALEGGVTSTFHNPVEVQTDFGDDVDYLVLTAATIDAKVFFPNPRQRLKPFIQGGLGVYLLDSENFGAQSVGTGFQLGGGFELPLGPNIDLGLRALYRGIAMGPPDSDKDDTFVSAISAEANLSIHF